MFGNHTQDPYFNDARPTTGRNGTLRIVYQMFVPVTEYVPQRPGEGGLAFRV
jgi:hypothetical protein